MATATMTSKGQITVPKEVRDDMGLTAGSKVMFVKVREGFYRIVPRTGKAFDLIGPRVLMPTSSLPTPTATPSDSAAAEQS